MTRDRDLGSWIRWTAMQGRLWQEFTALSTAAILNIVDELMNAIVSCF